MQARDQSLEDAVQMFLVASVGYRIGRAGRLLAERPEIAGHSLQTALVLGDAERVGRELAADPQLASRRDPQTGWTALHAVCASRWHVDPARAPGLFAAATLLVDAGADAGAVSANGRWLPLECAVTSAQSGRANEPIIRLLLDRGATVFDAGLYNAGFAGSWCVQLLLEHAGDIAEIAEQALGAPVSTGDAESVRLLLEAGADPARYRDGDGRRVGVIGEALGAGAPTEVIELLLAYGADASAPGADGRSPYRLASARDRGDVVALLARHGARDDRTAIDRLLSACRHGDREAAMRLAAEHPDLRGQLTEAEATTIMTAAEDGDAEAVALMLDVGLPIDARRSDDGATALHLAAYAGSAETVELLLARGADIEAHDASFDANALDWAVVGSGDGPSTAAAPDWEAVVRMLLDAGSSTAGITLSDGEPKQPSREVASLLRARGVGAGSGA